MQWKNVLVQSVIILTLLLVVGKFYTPTHPEFTTSDQSCSEQCRKLEGRLEQIERVLAVRDQGASNSSGIAAGTVTSAEIKQMLVGISDRLTRLEKDISASNRQKTPAGFAFPSPGGGFLPGTGMPGDPVAFMQGLPEEKRRRINQIFRDQAGILQSRMTSTGGGPLDVEAMKEVMEQNEQELREKLRQVLDEEEYQKFEDFLPKPSGMQPPFSPGGRNQ